MRFLTSQGESRSGERPGECDSGFRIPNHVSAIFAKKMVRVPPKTASRIPKAWPGPARGAGARITNPESRITLLPFSPKKWSGYLRRPQAESRKLGPARPEGQGPESRIPNPESRFCHFRRKKMVRVPPKTASRIPKAWPGPARGAGARITNPESRITFLPFSKKMVRVPPKTASRIPKAWPGPARGAGARITNPESRFCHLRQKNGPGTSEDRKPNPESLARPGPRGRGPNHESRITFLPFSPKKWSGYLRRPQAESRKLGPARPEAGARITNPESRFCHFRQKNGPGTSEDRKPNPESLARPGPRGRGPNPESRITFLPFSPKKWSGYLRRPQAESRKLGPARGPESRIPNHVSAIFAKKMVRVPPKTASRIPKAWPGPARGAGARITNPESRFCHFRQKNGPGASEDRKPNPESLARPGPRGRGPNHESRITFLPFSPKKWSGYLRRPQAESRKLGPARPEGQGPESRIPNHVCAIFAKKMVRVPPKTASRIPKAWPGPARGAGARIANPESRFCHFRQKNGPGTSEDRKPNPESLARPGPRGRGPNPESRFCHFRQKNGPGTSEDRKPNPESLARPGPRGRGPNHESRIPNHVSASPLKFRAWG